MIFQQLCSICQLKMQKRCYQKHLHLDLYGALIEASLLPERQHCRLLLVWNRLFALVVIMWNVLLKLKVEIISLPILTVKASFCPQSVIQLVVGPHWCSTKYPPIWLASFSLPLFQVSESPVRKFVKLQVLS